MKLSIIVPVYNEQDTIIQVLDNLCKLAVAADIVIVDDCSADRTSDLIMCYKGKGRPRWKHPTIISAYWHHKNKGKGACIQTAQKYITGDVVVIQDADLEMNPDELLKMVSIMDAGYDAVYGVRDFSTTRKVYRYGNKLLTWFCNWLYGSDFQDIMSCYKMMWTDTFKSLKLESNGFEIEAEITAKLLKKGVKIQQIPVSYHPRRKGKKIRIRDGFKIIKTLVKYANN